MNVKFEFDPQAAAARVVALKKRFAYQFNGGNIGHDIEPGWITLVEQVCADVDAQIQPMTRETFCWRQIKEKFGGLRMYYAPGPLRIDIHTKGKILSITDDIDRIDPISAIVSRAEAASFQICAVCGATGELRKDRSWFRTLCERHAVDNERDTMEMYWQLIALHVRD
jgi:hypothetical protein